MSEKSDEIQITHRTIVTVEVPGGAYIATEGNDERPHLLKVNGADAYLTDRDLAAIIEYAARLPKPKRTRKPRATKPKAAPANGAQAATGAA